MAERLHRHWVFVRDIAVHHPWQILTVAVILFAVIFVSAVAEARRR